MNYVEQISNIIFWLEIILIVLIGLAYITLAERKILGSIQRRLGPDRIGIFGILQPITDGIKLLIKESIMPQQSNKIYYIIGPIITLTLCLIVWIPVPFNIRFVIREDDLGILYILAISSIGIISLLYSGWSSNSKYALIGSMRSIAQLISYEISIGIIIMPIIILNGSLNLNIISYNQIYLSNIFALFPIFILFFISAIAETNRPPFDLPEAESELIAGYIIEYGGFLFAAIYLAEYAFIFLMCTLMSILFVGTINIMFTIFLIYSFVWLRATLPRLRYNHLIILGWKYILSISISYMILTISILYVFI